VYSTAQAAEALGVTPKRFDNLLSGPGRKIVAPGRHGLSRSISIEAIEIFALALLLERDLGSRLERAVEIAAELRKEPAHDVAVGALGALRYDVPRLRYVLQNALADALENRLQPRRGRPPTIKTIKRGASL